MSTHVTDTTVTISRPNPLVFLMQLAVLVIIAVIITVVQVAMTSHFERQFNDVIVAFVWALMFFSAPTAIILWFVRKLPDKLWQQALIRKQLEAAPYNYKRVSFPGFGKYVEFNISRDNSFRMKLDAVDPEEKKWRYNNSYDLVRLGKDH